MRRYFTPGASGGLVVGTVLSVVRERGASAAFFASALASAFSPSAFSPPLFPRTLVAIAPPGLLLGLTRLLLDLGDEVVGSLLQALADLVAHEAADLHVLAGLGDEVREQRADVLLPLGVLDPNLIEEAALLGPLRHLAVDDLAEHRLGLARLLGLLDADALFLFQHVGGDFFLRDVLGIHGGHLHGYLFA